MRNVDSCRQLLLYGNGGIWLTDSKASYFKDFNEGLPEGADYRQIKNVIRLIMEGYLLSPLSALSLWSA